MASLFLFSFDAAAAASEVVDEAKNIIVQNKEEAEKEQPQQPRRELAAELELAHITVDYRMPSIETKTEMEEWIYENYFAILQDAGQHQVSRCDPGGFCIDRRFEGKNDEYQCATIIWHDPIDLCDADLAVDILSDYFLNNMQDQVLKFWVTKVNEGDDNSSGNGVIMKKKKHRKSDKK